MAPTEERFPAWLWVAVITVALDLALRVVLSFRLRDVALGEVVLFAVAIAWIHSLSRPTTVADRPWRQLRLAIMVFFALGGERAALFAGGFSLPHANLLTMLSAIALAFGWYATHRDVVRGAGDS